MSVDLKKVVNAVLKFIAWTVFKDTYRQARKKRVDRINAEYVEKIKSEMFKDE